MPAAWWSAIGKCRLQVTRAVMWQPVTSDVVIDDSSDSCACSCWGDIVDAEGEPSESDPFGGDVGYQVGAVSGPMASMYGGSAAGGNFGGFFGGTGGGFLRRCAPWKRRWWYWGRWWRVRRFVRQQWRR